MKPVVSIITASYNYEKYIVETINSVLNQTYQNWEMIIVDDGSTDNSLDVIKKYCEKDSRIKLFQHENGVNKGLPDTVKLGIEKASGEWITFLESDDSIVPEYLEEKFKIINNNPSVNFIFNDVNMFGDEQTIKSMDTYLKKRSLMLKTRDNPTNYLKDFRKINIVPTFSVVMLRRSLCSDINFKVSNPPCLDIYLWAQIALKTDFYYLEKALTNWRMHGNSYISKSLNRMDLNYIKYRLELEDIVGKNDNSIIHFCRKLGIYFHYFLPHVFSIKNEYIDQVKHKKINILGIHFII